MCVQRAVSSSLVFAQLRALYFHIRPTAKHQPKGVRVLLKSQAHKLFLLPSQREIEFLSWRCLLVINYQKMSCRFSRFCHNSATTSFKFPSLLDRKLLERVDKMLAEDIAKMMAMVPLEETVSKNEGTDRYAPPTFKLLFEDFNVKEHTTYF